MILTTRLLVRSMWTMRPQRTDSDTANHVKEGRRVLLVAGELDLAPMESSVWYLGDQATAVGANKNRRRTDFPCRSVYLPVMRSGLYEMFRSFDFPDPAVVSGNRSETIVAPQALFMMNSELMLDVVAALERLSRDEAKDDASRIEWLYERVLGRLPREVEHAAWRLFLNAYQEEWSEESNDRKTGVWRAACRVLLASNEFVYIE